MSESLARTLALYSAAVAVLSLVGARGGLRRAHAGAAVVLVVFSILDALIAGVGVLGGSRAAEPVPFAGYLLLSLLVVPIGWRYARGSARGWDEAIFALACFAQSVICVRLVRTWG